MICIYHKNCADGFGAAWVVRQAINEEIEFIAAQHGENPPDVTGQNVIIVDFSYSRDALIQMNKDASSLQVIDHHRTAQQNCEGLDFALFDMNYCGAILTWKYFYGNQTVPQLLWYIQDRDLWTWKLPKSREVSAALRSYPFDFDLWDYFITQDGLSKLMIEGEAILRYQQQQVNIALSQKYELIEIGEYKVPCLNSTHLISEIANELCKGYPFAACYFDTDDKRVFSLRSDENGIDVSQIAKQYGGGGHPRAAGFTIIKPEILIANKGER